jgi:hypothetical protein
MDLTPGEEQRDLIRLAAEILGDAAERGTPDTELWAALARAGLIGTSVEEGLGGLGLGFTEVGLLLEEAGRTASTVPLPQSCVAAAVIGAVGSEGQRRALLGPLAAGDSILTIALSEQSCDPLTPLLTAEGGSGRWLLSGARRWVPAAALADRFLVSVELAGRGPRLVVLDAGREGLSLTSGPGDGRLDLDRVRITVDDVLDDPRAVALAVQFTTAAACAQMAGALSRMVRLTADYATTREQFGRPIASFQAVGQRAADAFTSAWSVELTARQACWVLSATGRADGHDAARAVAVAKYTAASAAAEVIRAAHHLHGGIGLDRDYPLQRYTLLVKRLELLLGGASEQAELLGDLVADYALSATAPRGADVPLRAAADTVPAVG